MSCLFAFSCDRAIRKSIDSMDSPQSLHGTIDSTTTEDTDICEPLVKTEDTLLAETHMYHSTTGLTANVIPIIYSAGDISVTCSDDIVISRPSEIKKELLS